MVKGVTVVLLNDRARRIEGGNFCNSSQGIHEDGKEERSALAEESSCGIWGLWAGGEALVNIDSRTAAMEVGTSKRAVCKNSPRRIRILLSMRQSYC